MRFGLTVWQAAERRRLWFLLALVVATLSPVCMLAIINHIIKSPDTYRESPTYAVLFVLAAVGIVASQAVGSRIAVHAVEGMLHDLRSRCADGVRRIEYTDLERVQPARVYDTLTRNSPLISEAATIVLVGYSSIGSLLLGGLYTLVLSPIVFWTLFSLIAASVFLVLIFQRNTKNALYEANQAESGFLSFFSQMLYGFKEIRLHRPRGDDLEYNFVIPKSDQLKVAQLQATIRANHATSISLSFFYLMLATIAFVLPPYVDDIGTITQAIYVVVFLLSTVEGILRSLPMLSRADFALEELHSITSKLESLASMEGNGVSSGTFRTLTVVAGSYSYRDSHGVPTFSVGPLSCKIESGETLFIVGGNGSGKSTFLKMLCLLIPADSGCISIDGKIVDDSNADTYRSLFSAVFADFFLFDRLYGLMERSVSDVNDLLDDLGVGHKVRYEEGGFTTTDLSTGQRKRLALAVALLEQRPILILDELAADQDRDFRERFYREILPRLKRDGRTLIVVSHDDRYFDCADRVLHMRDGQLVPQSGDHETTS